MARIAIIVGHARKGSYCEALGQAYWRGARAAGHDATLFATSAMTFDPVLREGFERVQPLEPDLQSAHDAILAADHVVIIFPLWLGTLPAILKGFLERVYRWWFGAHAVKMLKRNILGFVGVRPIRTTIYGSIEGAGDERRRRWLKEIEALGREAA